jgi:transcriptional regulator with XRE-family HTH domain
LKDLKKIIGRRIAKSRKNSKYSQEQLAELANIHPTFVSAVERGTKHASVNTLHKIVQALNMTLEELFKGIQ